MNMSLGLGDSAASGLAPAKKRDALEPESSAWPGAERKRVRVEEEEDEEGQEDQEAGRSNELLRFYGAGSGGGAGAAAAGHHSVWKPISCLIERSLEQCRMSLGMTVEVIRSTSVATARIEKHLEPRVAVPDFPRSVADFGRVCLVVRVVPGGIGAAHGIRAGDIITSVNGQYVHSIEDIIVNTREASLLQVNGWRVILSPGPSTTNTTTTTTMQQRQQSPKAAGHNTSTQAGQLAKKTSTSGNRGSVATVVASPVSAPEPVRATSASVSPSLRSSSSPVQRHSRKKTSAEKVKPALEPEEAAAVANYAAYHGVSIDCVSLKQVKRSQGGVDVWRSVNFPRSPTVSGAPPARDDASASSTALNDTLVGESAVDSPAPRTIPFEQQQQQTQQKRSRQPAAFVQFMTEGTCVAGTSTSGDVGGGDGGGRKHDVSTQAHVARDIVHAALDSIEMKFDSPSGLFMVTSAGPAAATLGVSRNDILIGAQWESRQEQPSRGPAFAEAARSFKRKSVTVSSLSLRDSFFRCPQGTLLESLLSCRPTTPQFPQQASSGAHSGEVLRLRLRLTLLKVLYQPVVTMFDDVGEYDGRIVAMLPPVKFKGSVADTVGLRSPWSVSVAYSDGDDLPLSLRSAVEAMNTYCGPFKRVSSATESVQALPRSEARKKARVISTKTKGIDWGNGEFEELAPRCVEESGLRALQFLANEQTQWIRQKALEQAGHVHNVSAPILAALDPALEQLKLPTWIRVRVRQAVVQDNIWKERQQSDKPNAIVDAVLVLQVCLSMMQAADLSSSSNHKILSSMWSVRIPRHLQPLLRLATRRLRQLKTPVTWEETAASINELLFPPP